MITKYNKYDKLFESLPRQSTVDQLKRIRDEIKKSQEIIVGPEHTHMKGDVGDRVIDDLVKHKGKQEMNNLFWWDNPLDRHIDSYETFVQSDSRDSLGYTKDGDPKKHKGTDYVKESSDKINEEWSQQDTEYLELVVRNIQRRVPTFGVNFNGYNGSVHVDGKVVFNTSGHETPSVISAYVNGYLFGLGKGLSLK